MSAQSLIQQFNRLDGHALTMQTAKELHQKVQQALDHDGHGPHAKPLREVYSRLSNFMKVCKMKNVDGVNKLNVEPVKYHPGIGIRDIAKLGKPGKPARKRKKLKTVKKTVTKKVNEACMAGPRKPVRRKKAIVPGVKACDAKEIELKASKPVKVSKKSKKIAGSFGFVSADQAPEKPKNTFTLPGVMGLLLGLLQWFKLQIIISGETHSGKSQLGMQIANAFAGLGHEVAWVDWEQGGLDSKDTQASIERNVDEKNKSKIKVSGEVPRTLEALRKLAQQFKVIALDSGTKLNQATNGWIDTLREDHLDVVWIIMMQQNEKGGTRGGSAAEFDSPVVVKTYREDHSDYRMNYAEVTKNRGNATGIKYLIADKRIDKTETATI